MPPPLGCKPETYAVTRRYAELCQTVPVQHNLERCANCGTLTNLIYRQHNGRWFCQDCNWRNDRIQVLED